MKKNDVFPGKYIKHADLGGCEVRVTMDYTEMKEMQGQDEEKPVLYFKDKTKGLVVNVTNWDTIEDADGDESDDWHDSDIVLCPAKTRFGGKMVDCIRVRVPKDSEDAVVDGIPF